MYLVPNFYSNSLIDLAYRPLYFIINSKFLPLNIDLYIVYIVSSFYSIRCDIF